MSPSNVIKVSTTYDKFFEYWLRFYQPIHMITAARDFQVAVEVLREWFKLNEAVKDENIVKNEYLSAEHRRRISEALGIKKQNFDVILSNLRKIGFITEDNTINNKYIPCFDQNGKVSLAVLYDIKK